MKQHDRYLATQECFMDYQIASPIRIVTVKMIMSLFLLRMNFTLKKERITVTSSYVHEIRRSRLRDKFIIPKCVMRHWCCLTSHITRVRIRKINRIFLSRQTWFVSPTIVLIFYLITGMGKSNLSSDKTPVLCMYIALLHQYTSSPHWRNEAMRDTRSNCYSMR